MGIWEGLGTALISAVVALVVSVIFRWWDRKSVKWFTAGTFTNRSSEMRGTIEVFNVGDGDAYDVRTRRCNCDRMKNSSFDVFEAACVSGGKSFSIRFNVPEHLWESAWVEIIAKPSPSHRRKAVHSGRIFLHAVANRASLVHSREAMGGGWVIPDETLDQPIVPTEGE